MRRCATWWCSRAAPPSVASNAAALAAAVFADAAATTDAGGATGLDAFDSQRMTPAAFRCVLALAAQPGGAAELEAAEHSTTGLAAAMRVLHNPAHAARPFEAAYVELRRDDAGANRRHGGVPSGPLPPKQSFVDTRKARVDFAALARATAAAAAQKQQHEDARAARVERDFYNSSDVGAEATQPSNGFVVSTVFSTNSDAGRAGFATVAARVAAGKLPGTLRNMTGQCGYAAWECRPEEYNRVLREIQEDAAAAAAADTPKLAPADTER